MANKQGVRRIAPDRTHHYIDIENIAGCGRPPRSTVASVKDCLMRITETSDRDLFTIGCDAGSTYVVGSVFKGARIVWGYGPDGADHALLDAMNDDIASGFGSQRITVASGDHIFAPMLARFAQHNVVTRVIGVQGHTSSQLKLASHQTTLISESELPLYKWSA